MPKKEIRRNNMRLAGLFIVLVLGLILLSVFLKVFFLIKDSRFDGNHKFNVTFIAKDKTSVVSFSPLNQSLTILSVNDRTDRNSLSKSLAIPIDGKIIAKENINKNNLSWSILKTALSLGNSVEHLTTIDLIRLFLFSRSVPDTNIYERELADKFNEAQKSTIISLSFTDPTIYEENKTIEIINASDIYGLGGKLANLISNMGGNVLLVSSGDKKEAISKIIYSGEITYTVKKLSSYLNFPLENKKTKGITDVIIIIGADRAEQDKF